MCIRDRLQALSFLSRDAMHALLEQENLEFGHLRNGKLIAYRSAALLENCLLYTSRCV